MNDQPEERNIARLAQHIDEVTAAHGFAVSQATREALIMTLQAAFEFDRRDFESAVAALFRSIAGANNP